MYLIEGTIKVCTVCMEEFMRVSTCDKHINAGIVDSLNEQKNKYILNRVLM